MRTRHLTVRLPIWIDSLKEFSEFPSNLKHSVISIVSALSVVVLDRSKVILVVIMNGSPVTYPYVEGSFGIGQRKINGRKVTTGGIKGMVSKSLSPKHSS